MMKKQNLLALLTIGLLLAVSSLLSQRMPTAPDSPRAPSNPAVELMLEPSSRSCGGLDASLVALDITLRSRTSEPVKVYNSLVQPVANNPPGFTALRLRDASGNILMPLGAQSDGFWTQDFTLTERVPAVLQTLPPYGDISTRTDLAILLRGFPDETLLATASQAQVRCVVFLEHGLVEQKTDWLPLYR